MLLLGGNTQLFLHVHTVSGFGLYQYSNNGFNFLLQAYCFAADTFLDEDQCGKAIRALRESDKCNYTLFLNLCCYLLSFCCQF